MGEIIILPETTKDPISLIGRRAGVCYGANIADAKKNYERGLDCIKSNHGRTLEYVNVESIISGYSARVIREWYTHIGGAPTRLQSSTRYIGYKEFKYVTPKKIKENEEALKIYDDTMHVIASARAALKELGITNEDSANLLPLGMETKIVDKRNVRNIIDMSRQRMCTRALQEYRDMFSDYLKVLSEYSEEWATLIPMVMMPKCEATGFCTETKSCGRKPKKPIEGGKKVVSIELSPNKELVKEIRAKLKENGGYCPCMTVKNEDTKCMCKDFRENVKSGPCHCGLYIKSER